MIAKMKTKASVAAGPTSNIVTSVMSKANVASSAQLPHPSLLARTLRRVKKKENPTPPEPTSATDFKIPAEYKMTQKDELFLYYDSKDEDENIRTLIFTTNTNLNTLSSCEIWQADDTFSCVPPLFQQLYTLHGYIDKQTLPLVYVLTTGKSTKTYRSILEQLININANLKPKKVICDYETAFHKAMTKTFPQIQIRGCFFHLTQCIWRGIQRCGLQQQYSCDSMFALNLKMLASLAFVPEIDVVYAYEQLLHTKFYKRNEELLSTLIDYLEENWIGQLNRRSVRQPPRFAIHLWNQYNSVLEEIPRTNNNVEGWHNALNTRAEASHLSVWKLINLLKSEQNLTDVKISQIEASTESPLKRRKYRDIDAGISNIVASHDKSKVISCLRGLANNISY